MPVGTAETGMAARAGGAGSRRLLQATVAVLSLVPLSAGAAGVILGPGLLGVQDGGEDLDSHFRYLSGIFLALGLTFCSTVPAIERRTARFRLAAALVVCGGLGRLLSLQATGVPSTPHLVGLLLELVAVPLLALWQALVARGHAAQAWSAASSDRQR